MTTISRSFEWDMGHRVTNHASLCRNPHGHRYKMVVEIAGAISQEHGASDEGMIVDFGAFKELVKQRVVEKLDHSFMFWEKDEIMKPFAATNADLKMHAVPFIPTAECIVQHLAGEISLALSQDLPDISLISVSVFETPNSQATWRVDND